MNTTNPILFLLSVDRHIDFVERIYNHNGCDWLSIDGSNHPIKTPIDWQFLEAIHGEGCTKSIKLTDLVQPSVSSLYSDMNMKVMFVDEGLEDYLYGPLSGYMIQQGGNEVWLDPDGDEWAQCFKVLPDIKKNPRLPIAKPSDNRPLSDYAPFKSGSQIKSWGDFDSLPHNNEISPNAGFMWVAPENKTTIQEIIENNTIPAKHISARDYSNNEQVKLYYITDQLADFATQQDRFEDHDTNQRVELISKASDYEGGWFGTWPEELEIGHVFRFFGLHGSRGVKVISCENFRTYFLPYFVLDVIRESLSVSEPEIL